MTPLCETHRQMLENYLVVNQMDDRYFNTGRRAQQLYDICHRNVPDLKERLVAFFGPSYYLDDMRLEEGDWVWCKSNMLPNHQDITPGKAYKVRKLDYGSLHNRVSALIDNSGRAVVPSGRFTRVI